jgi:hypothetical protein
MKMKKLAILFSVVALVATSCTIDQKFPVFITNNTIQKVGVVTKTCPFNICFGNINLGAGEAAKAGGIQKIATVDNQIEGGFFTVKYSTVVTGE